MKEWATPLASPPQTAAQDTSALWTMGEESIWAKPGMFSATERKVRGSFAPSLCEKEKSSPDFGSFHQPQADARITLQEITSFLTLIKKTNLLLTSSYSGTGQPKAFFERVFAHTALPVCTFQMWTAPASQVTWGMASPVVGICCKYWCPSQHWQTSCR